MALKFIFFFVLKHGYWILLKNTTTAPGSPRWRYYFRRVFKDQDSEVDEVQLSYHYSASEESWDETPLVDYDSGRTNLLAETNPLNRVNFHCPRM